jgi:hypothetical protein
LQGLKTHEICICAAAWLASDHKQLKMSTASGEVAFSVLLQAKTDDSIERNGFFDAFRRRKRRQYRANLCFSCLDRPKTMTVWSEMALCMLWQTENDDSIERNGLFDASAGRKRQQYRAKRHFTCFRELKTLTVSSETAFSTCFEASKQATVSSETAFFMPWHAESDDRVERNGPFQPFGPCRKALKQATVSSKMAFFVPWQAENDDSIERNGTSTFCALLRGLKTSDSIERNGLYHASAS